MEHSFLHLKERKIIPSAPGPLPAWGTRAVEADGAAQAMGSGPHSPPGMGCAFLSMKGEAGGGCFRQQHSSWGLLGGLGGNGPPAAQGRFTALCLGRASAPELAVFCSRTKATPGAAPVPPEPPPHPAPGSKSPQQTLTGTSSSSRPAAGGAEQRHPAEVPLSLPQPSLPPCVGLCTGSLMAERSSPHVPASWSPRSLSVHL